MRGSTAAALACLALAVAGCDEVDRADASGTDRDAEAVLVTYAVVDGTRLGDAWPEELDDGALVALRDDHASHRWAWELWLDVAPEPWESSVRELRMVTDGPEDDLAGVVRSGQGGWTLELDAADLADREELVRTLVHELAHLLSLAPGQVDPDRTSFDLLTEAAEECAPDPGVEDGCLVPTSYLGRFIDRFWDAAALEAADEISWSEDPDALVEERYDAAPERFVSEYAATHPEEDLAESWVVYVFDEWQLGDPGQPWVAKVAFFDGFPELRAAREEIRERLGVG